MLWHMGPVGVIAAHPDDETIGLSSQLPLWRDVHVIHVTDGAPRNGRDAAMFGFTGPDAYAQARRAELTAAMAVAGIGEDRLCPLGFADQEASLHMAALAERLREIFGRLRLEIVYTHSYEGGHPDHDATAFAVHAACALLRADAPAVWEFTSYHAVDGAMRTFEFLQGPGCPPPHTIRLSAAERERKSRMLACFASQQQFLREFPVEIEVLRESPGYDFTRPPHVGKLFYEQFDWGMDGERWRAQARRALESLGIKGNL